MQLPEDYPALLERLDTWQERVRAAHPGVIPCRPGCAACCHGPFDISGADALLVAEGVRGLPEADRAELRRRAALQMDIMREREPTLAFPWNMAALGEVQFDLLCDHLATQPCPALDDQGRCRIYRYRPMVCHLMGVGIVTTSGEVIENACPIQNDFPAYRDLPPQPFDLEAWEALEARFLGESMDYETTVAGAILLEASGGLETFSR